MVSIADKLPNVVSGTNEATNMESGRSCSCGFSGCCLSAASNALAASTGLPAALRASPRRTSDRSTGRDRAGWDGEHLSTCRALKQWRSRLVYRPPAAMREGERCGSVHTHRRTNTHSSPRTQDTTHTTRVSTGVRHCRGCIRRGCGGRGAHIP